MPGTAEKTTTRPDPGDVRHAEIYDRHAAAVYGQALLMLGDADLAGEVARDVIVTECVLPAVSPSHADRVSGLLAASTMRRCQELMAGQAGKNQAARGRHTRGYSAPPVSPGLERALLGLVLFGRMGYREAARELAISPSRAATLLRSALVTQPSPGR